MGRDKGSFQGSGENVLVKNIFWLVEEGFVQVID